MRPTMQRKKIRMGTKDNDKIKQERKRGTRRCGWSRQSTLFFCIIFVEEPYDLAANPTHEWGHLRGSAMRCTVRLRLRGVGTTAWVTRASDRLSCPLVPGVVNTYSRCSDPGGHLDSFWPTCACSDAATVSPCPLHWCVCMFAHCFRVLTSQRKKISLHIFLPSPLSPTDHLNAHPFPPTDIQPSISPYQ